MFDDSTPIFVQSVDQLCAGIVAGTYPGGAKAPSINELVVSHRVDPATTDRAIALSVKRGILIRHHRIGMFVTDGARPRLIEERRQALADRYVRPLIAEAATLGVNGRELIVLIQKEVNP